ncbi:ubiquitin-specific protease UBP6 [Aspergillus nidulans FGSC A4]|uniref:Thioesterase family protein (AFU_orthologue AFUA_6G02390) n=1 Tax=Emericella nidulans (strain FGSC A4 / ATCC 38163 / CBS 112.46 / NRRL 194 / M139) TaxID=227321 RepID=C8VA48_EMENI|nr:ubiquitin-specific protease UBP6 [Aspergillus nidulans FGSC A4]CBF78210.1 TPA: thioesterase family protein (AFU_orthologue; AFUA_6G02390) [Aspergillus nidulans FGSC A4]
MFGARQVVHARLRHAAAQRRPVPRLLPYLSRNVSSVGYQPAPKRRPWLRRFVYAGIFGGIGLGYGHHLCQYLDPPLTPGSPMDESLTNWYNDAVDKLPLMKELRENPDYVETKVYGNFSKEDKAQRLTSGPLSGASRLAFQRVFWNHKDKTAYNFVYIGHGMEGWPFVVHGGALATVLDEHLARVAIQHFPERTAVTANLDINYLRAATSNGIYVFSAKLDEERSTDRKAYVIGSVRDKDGNVCTVAKGLFVVPRGYKLRKLEGAF